MPYADRNLSYGNLYMISVNQYCRQEFGEKLYKISLSGGFTCPNRDGRLGTGGCIFCSQGGSGDFAESASLSIDEQIEKAKKRVADKFHGERYIAYFQAFTNTYAPVETLRKLYIPVAHRDDIAVISIATRPDCLGDDVLLFLEELNKLKPLWVELGLQTTNRKSAEYIRRGYDLSVYDTAVEKLNSIGIHCVTHVILGLPNETEDDMLGTVRHVVNSGCKGIKLQLLHVLKNTDLAADYAEGKFRTMEMDEYLHILKKCVSILPEDMVVHRFTGDGAKKDLIAPLWTGDKKRVLNAIKREIDI